MFTFLRCKSKVLCFNIWTYGQNVKSKFRNRTMNNVANTRLKFFFYFPAEKPWIYEQKIMSFAHRTALAGVLWQCGFFFNFRDQLHVVGDCS